MADLGEGPRGMDNLNLGDRSVANQGNIRVSNYYRSSSPSPAPIQACVSIGLPRRPNDVKRPDLLFKLRRMLPDGERHEPVALWGLAGSGKSRVALQYAKERSSRRGCSVFWIHANDEATFVSSFKTIAQNSKGIIDKSLDGTDLLLAVKQWIESQRPWVLVIDGADDVGFFIRNRTSSLNPLEFIPDSEEHNGTTIWTSRDRRILNLNHIGWTRGLQVDCMSTDDAVSLLQNTANHGGRFNNPDAALKLVQELDCNPLAISHVAESMRDQALPPEEMLSHLADSRRRRDILGSPCINPNWPEDENNSILEVLGSQAWHLAFRDTEAHRIITMIASLQDLDTILPDMFFEADQQKEKNSTRSIITRLIDLSILHQVLAATGGPSYRIDRLVQEAIHYRLAQRTLPSSGTLHFDSHQIQRNHAALELELRPRRHSVKELLEKFPKRIHYDTLGLCKPLVDAALDVFTMSQWAPPEQSTLFESASLLTQVGNYLNFCGRWREMETPYRKAWEFRQKSGGDEDYQTLAAMDALADVYSNLGYYQKALDLFLKARRIRAERLHFDETHRVMMTGNMNIAATRHELGQFQLAGQLMDDTLNLQVKILGKQHLDTARTMFAKVQVSLNQEALDKRLELSREAMEITSCLLGDEDPTTLETASSLGIQLILSQDGNDEGRKILREAFDAQQRLLGPRHPCTLFSKMFLGLGSARGTAADKIRVELVSEPARGLHQRLGRSHPHTTMAMDAVAFLLKVVGKLPEAAVIFKDNVDEFSRRLGRRHYTTLSTQVTLAEIYLDMGRVAESKDLVSAVRYSISRLKGEALIQAYEPVSKDAESLWTRISERSAAHIDMDEGEAQSAANRAPRRRDLFFRYIGSLV